MRLPIAALLLLLATSPASADTIAGRATVIDGDTLEIHGERIRIGLSASEFGRGRSSCRGSGEAPTRRTLWSSKSYPTS